VHGGHSRSNATEGLCQDRGKALAEQQRHGCASRALQEATKE
jgi:hypothetical protein